MPGKRLTDQRLDERVKGLIGQQLRDYYNSCISEELPPRLLAVLKKLNEKTELPEKQAQVIGDIKT